MTAVGTPSDRSRNLRKTPQHHHRDARRMTHQLGAMVRRCGRAFLVSSGAAMAGLPVQHRAGCARVAHDPGDGATVHDELSIGVVSQLREGPLLIALRMSAQLFFSPSERVNMRLPRMVCSSDSGAAYGGWLRISSAVVCNRSIS